MPHPRVSASPPAPPAAVPATLPAPEYARLEKSAARKTPSIPHSSERDGDHHRFLTDTGPRSESSSPWLVLRSRFPQSAGLPSTRSSLLCRTVTLTYPTPWSWRRQKCLSRRFGRG